MASSFPAFIFLLPVLLAPAISKIPSFEERICGEDGVAAIEDKRWCHTNITGDKNLLTLNWRLAKEKCRLRGGSLITRDFVRISKQSELFEYPLWVEENDKKCQILENKGAEPVKGHCDSTYRVVCKWKRGTASAKCPEGYRWAGTKCYRVFGQLSDGLQSDKLQDLGNKARERCKRDEAQLASVTNDLEYSAILSLINGHSDISLVVKFYSGYGVVLGDKEPRPGLFVRTVNSWTLYGYICEKTAKRPLRSAEHHCGSGFVSFAPKLDLCFKKGEGKTEWKDAEEFCRKEYSFLPSIHSLYDNATVHLARLQLEDAEDMWLGSNDSLNWIDGSRIVFKEFQSGSFLPRKCLTMDLDGIWKWADCKNRRPFYCFKRRATAHLPQSCDKKSEEKIKFRGSCYSHPCGSHRQLRIDSRELVNLLLTWKVGHNSYNCLKVAESDARAATYTNFDPKAKKPEAMTYDSEPQENYMYIDVEGRWTFKKCRHPILICNEEPAKQPEKKSDSSLLIIIILSSLLGLAVIAVFVGIAIYCTFFRSSAAQPASEMWTPPAPAALQQPVPVERFGLGLARRTLPSPMDKLAPVNNKEVETCEDEMDDIYDDIDEIER